MNRLDERLKNGLGMFTSKDDDIAAVEDSLQRIDKPPTLFRYNGDFFKTESREMYALVHGEPAILTKCTEKSVTYRKYAGFGKLFSSRSVCGDIPGIFHLSVPQLSTPITEDARCITGKGALIPYKKGGMVFMG